MQSNFFLPSRQKLYIVSDSLKENMGEKGMVEDWEEFEDEESEDSEFEEW